MLMLTACRFGFISSLKQMDIKPDDAYELFICAALNGQLLCCKWLWYHYKSSIRLHPCFKYLGIHLYQADQKEVYEWVAKKTEKFYDQSELFKNEVY
jgi:hypothetical protein